MGERTLHKCAGKSQSATGSQHQDKAGATSRLANTCVLYLTWPSLLHDHVLKLLSTCLCIVKQQRVLAILEMQEEGKTKSVNR